MITGELREFAERWPRTDQRHADMLCIADRIDAEYEDRLGRVYAALDDALRKLEELRRCSVELPVDADGVNWRIGDRVRSDRLRTIAHMDLASDGWRIYMRDSEGNVGSGAPDRYSHHYEPTVGDILDELEGMRGYGDSTYEDVVTRCAELAGKLRELLGGDGE